MSKKPFSQIKTIHKPTAILVVLIVASIGTYLLVGSHAASPYATVTAPNGNLAGGAENCPTAGATTGNATVFNPPVPMDSNVALGLGCPGTPFAPNSFWNTLLPASIPPNPNNAAYLNDIAYDICYATPVTSAPPPTCSTTYQGGINTSSYSAPLYVVPANQPLVPVESAPASLCDGSNGASSSLFVNSVVGSGVPIPADAHAAAGTDEHIQIYQPSADKYWEFWKFAKDASGNWEACWGGLIGGIVTVNGQSVQTHVSTSDGIFPSDTGGTATSLPLLGGIPRIEELQAGQINHVMGLGLGNVASGDLASNVVPANPCPPSGVSVPCATNGVSWPATRSDGQSTYNLAIPEGLRFRLPTCLHLPTDSQTCVSLATYGNNPSTKLTPIAMTIAAAAQKYGFVVDDSGANPGAGIRVGDPTTYTAAGLPNPYTSGPGVGGIGNQGLFDGVTQGAILNNFPWNQLEALPFNYGEPASP